MDASDDFLKNLSFNVRGRPADDWSGNDDHDWGLGSRVSALTTHGQRVEGIAIGAAQTRPFEHDITIRTASGQVHVARESCVKLAT